MKRLYHFIKKGSRSSQWIIIHNEMAIKKEHRKNWGNDAPKKSYSKYNLKISLCKAKIM
ncbi:hypothetical protein LAD12857_43750 [Lacrimispora amygdalina]|uniref:Uncharacterized protein n=1 Tax=Lacrimispora amygdalina TaxID=253257 RepID=A0ABQ5MC94_9FIRM